MLDEIVYGGSAGDPSPVESARGDMYISDGVVLLNNIAQSFRAILPDLGGICFLNVHRVRNDLGVDQYNGMILDRDQVRLKRSTGSYEPRFLINHKTLRC